MIDVRAHLLPGFIDGPKDLELALDMARLAVADGVLVSVCTPPYTPGLSTPSAADIREAVAEFSLRLIEAHIPLHVVPGCEVHFGSDLVCGFESGKLLSLNGSRYVLIDLPQMVPPAKLDTVLQGLVDSGRTPIIAAPEKLKWIEAGFDFFADMTKAGVWLQVTAGSLTGQFGKRTQYWAERLIGSSMVHVLASDGHDFDKRRPILAEARTLAANIVGDEEANNLVLTRPLNILDDEPSEAAPKVWSRSTKTGTRWQISAICYSVPSERDCANG